MLIAHSDDKIARMHR